MKRLAIIGLDCATWRIITPNDARLPTFRDLANKHISTTLISDVCRTHSAPIWTTFFSGIRAVEHGILDWTINGKAETRLWTRNDIPVRFYWEYYPKGQSYALAIPCVFPVLFYGKERPHNLVGLVDRKTLTVEGIKAQCNMLTNILAECLQDPKARFVAVVYRAADTACHLLDAERRIQVYEHLDKTLREWIMPHLKGWDWIILSDHGCENLDRTDNEVKLAPAEFYGNHHRDGILITNAEQYKSYQIYTLSRKLRRFVQAETHEHLTYDDTRKRS